MSADMSFFIAHIYENNGKELFNKQEKVTKK